MWRVVRRGWKNMVARRIIVVSSGLGHPSLCVSTTSILEYPSTYPSPGSVLQLLVGIVMRPPPSEHEVGRLRLCLGFRRHCKPWALEFISGSGMIRTAVGEHILTIVFKSVQEYLSIRLRLPKKPGYINLVSDRLKVNSLAKHAGSIQNIYNAKNVGKRGAECK